jgi:hypothetical protein
MLLSGVTTVGSSFGFGSFCAVSITVMVYNLWTLKRPNHFPNLRFMSSNADKTVASGWANIGSFALQSFALQSMSLIMKRKPRISVDLLVNIREQLDGALHNMETYKPIIEEELFQQFMDRYHGWVHWFLSPQQLTHLDNL